MEDILEASVYFRVTSEDDICVQAVRGSCHTCWITNNGNSAKDLWEIQMRRKYLSIKHFGAVTGAAIGFSLRGAK